MNSHFLALLILAGLAGYLWLEYRKAVPNIDTGVSADDLKRLQTQHPKVDGKLISLYATALQPRNGSVDGSTQVSVIMLMDHAIATGDPILSPTTTVYEVAGYSGTTVQAVAYLFDAVEVLPNLPHVTYVRLPAQRATNQVAGVVTI